VLNTQDISGNAALTICKSLLQALNDLDIISEPKVLDILRDAAVTHEDAPNGDDYEAMHKAVAALIRKIVTDWNSGRSH
jgi:hypothetical protein